MEQEVEGNIVSDLPSGYYIRQFANGIDSVLEDYYRTVVDLEKKFLRKPTVSLMFIFHELEKFRPLFEFLIRLINGIKTQKLYGCQILQYLEDNSLHGNEYIMEAVLLIQKSVYTIFIQQLCQWLNGKLVDTYNEFFIMNVDVVDGNEKRPAYNSQASFNTFHSSEPSINLDLWQYEINHNTLPYYFANSWAEKVLFIGQTVLMFNSDPRDSENAGFRSLENVACSSWIDRQHEIYQKFHQLQEMKKITVPAFERIVDEIKISVTEHLSDVAIKDADLIKQLKLIKDFYLLGRGELFHEFIKAIDPIYGNILTDNSLRDINRIFQVAAASVNTSDDAELFQFEMIKNNAKDDSFIYEKKGLFQHLQLRYKIKWPLHLLFSPKILDKYNDLFRFLIRIRKIQYDLQMLWCFHREEKIQRNNEVLQFRNQLMFLIDNLQYYLQVDVLESQYCIMMDKVKETKDFEEILRAHNCFQANVLGLCFLLESVSNPLHMKFPLIITSFFFEYRRKQR